MTQIYHQNNFGTALTSNVNAGDTTSPLNSIPSISAPFYIAFDATNVNGHYEVRQITSKTATNVLHSALTYPHTTSEEVRMVVPAEEMDDISARLNAGDYFYSGMARQAIMNGNFDIWQRGTSVAITDNAVIFQADRWFDYIDKNGGTLPTLTRTRQLLTSGDIPNAFYFTRLTTNGAGTSLGASSLGELNHRIENGTAKLCGLNKKVTVSFWARSSIANKRICPILNQNYGTGGSPTTGEAILGTPITLTSSWVKYTATFTTNTLVGKTFGTNGDDFLQLSFAYMWGTTWGNSEVSAGVTAETFVGAGNIDIAQVQLCAGDVALPFQPKSFEEELRACQRYFEKSFPYTTVPADNASRAGSFWNNAAATTSYLSLGTLYYKVQKRISVTPTLYLPEGIDASNKIRNLNTSTNIPSSIVNQCENGFGIQVNNASVIQSNQACTHWTAEAEL